MSPTNSLLFRQIDVIMFTLDCAGAFTGLNPAAERCFGRPAAELLGQPFTTVLDSFSAEKAAMMIARTLSEGGVTDRWRAAGTSLASSARSSTRWPI
jgi:PAS domain S-box-containing protein